MRYIANHNQLHRYHPGSELYRHIFGFFEYIGHCDKQIHVDSILNQEKNIYYARLRMLFIVILLAEWLKFEK